MSEFQAMIASRLHLYPPPEGRGFTCSWISIAHAAPSGALSLISSFFMTGMTAFSYESLRIIDNITNTASLLATVVGILCSRFQHLAETGVLAAEAQSKFIKQREVVGRCIEAMQNCEAKPPLSIGFDHVIDQIAIMSTSYSVEQLFGIVGIKPEVKAIFPSSTFMSLNRHMVEDFEARTGVKIIFSEQA